MPTFSNIDLEESATVTARVGTVQFSRGSTVELQEILCLGDPDSSEALTAVTNAAPASTRWGANVRIVSGPSSVADLAIRAVLPSTASDNPVTVSSLAGAVITRSSAADMLVTVYPQSSVVPAAGDSGVIVRQVGYSTTVNVSSLAGPVITRSSAADMLVTVYPQSSVVPAAGDSGVIVRQVGYSTIVAVSSLAGAVEARVNTSSGGDVEGSTLFPAQTVLGLHVREVPSSQQTFAASTVGQTSTATTLVSSAANQVIRVTAFSVTTTVVTASTVSFRSSLANVLWPLVLGSQSSGITGANLAVSPPNCLFQTQVANALVFHVPSSIPEYHISVRYSTGAA